MLQRVTNPHEILYAVQADKSVTHYGIFLRVAVCVAVRCSVCGVLQDVAARCSVLQRVASCCFVLQHVASW